MVINHHFAPTILDSIFLVHFFQASSASKSKICMIPLKLGGDKMPTKTSQTLQKGVYKLMSYANPRCFWLKKYLFFTSEKIVR